MIVAAKDGVHSVGLEERDQVLIHFWITPTAPGAICRYMQEDKLPRLCGGSQIARQPIVFGTVCAKVLVRIQHNKVGVPPVEGVELTCKAAGRIPRKIVNAEIGLVPTAPRLHFMVPDRGEEGNLPQHRLIDIEIVADILAPGAGAARADAAIEDHIPGVDDQVGVL
jgi:hypothetical protein